MVFSRLCLKRGIDFDHFDFKFGILPKGTTRAFRHYWEWQPKCIIREAFSGKLTEFLTSAIMPSRHWIWISGHALKTAVEKSKFWIFWIFEGTGSLHHLRLSGLPYGAYYLPSVEYNSSFIP